MRAHDAGWGLGFNTSGWGAVLIDNLAADPDHWQVRKLAVPQNDFRVLVGSAGVVIDGEHVVAFSVGRRPARRVSRSLDSGRSGGRRSRAARVVDWGRRRVGRAE